MYVKAFHAVKQRAKCAFVISLLVAHLHGGVQDRKATVENANDLDTTAARASFSKAFFGRGERQTRYAKNCLSGKVSAERAV